MDIKLGDLQEETMKEIGVVRKSAADQTLGLEKDLISKFQFQYDEIKKFVTENMTSMQMIT